MSNFGSMCLNGNLDQVRTFLSQDINVNMEDPLGIFAGSTLLHFACNVGNVEVVKLLLEDKRVDVNVRNGKGETPFFLACLSGGVGVVKLMLKDERVDVNKENVNGETPLIIAAGVGRVEIIKLMLISGRDVKLQHQDNRGRTALELAKRGKKDDIVDLLEKAINDPDYYRILRKENRLTSYLTPEEQLIIFYEEVTKGKAEKIYFASNDQTKIGGLFYSSCADGKIEMVQQMLNNEKRLNVNFQMKNGETPFFIACQNGHPEVVLALLKVKQTNVNQMNNQRETPLIKACMYDQWEVVKLILSNPSINIGAKTISGQTAKEIVKSKNNLMIYNLLNNYDTDEHQWNYLLQCFQSEEILIHHQTIYEANVQKFADEMEKSSILKKLILHNCGLTSKGALTILQSMMWNLDNSNFSLQVVEITNVELKSYEGIESIPIEVRVRGVQSIIDYILDAYQSFGAKPLYRTKVMTIGFENVGKTTLIDCLFPFSGYMRSQGDLIKTMYWFVLCGSILRKYVNNQTTEVHKEYILEKKKWKVFELPENGIHLIPIDTTKKEIKLYCESEKSRNQWINRIRRVILNSATCGIEIQKYDVDHPLISPLTSNLQISTWDFAGELDYYNNHYYFLTTRTVFLVVWNLSEGDEGLKGVDFWLKSLFAYVPKTKKNEKALFSIIVVGNFLDQPNVVKENASERNNQVIKIGLANGFQADDINYIEVSCETMKNIETLKSAIFSLAVAHEYIGERLPNSYLQIEKVIEELREKHSLLPIVELDYFLEFCNARSSVQFDFKTIKRALKFLHELGSCAYFDSPIELSNSVILSPHFLAKNIVAPFFSPVLQNNIQTGIINHSNLVLFWPNFKKLIPTFIALLEKFQVCFRSKNEDEKDFWDQQSVIPSLLPEEMGETIEEKLKVHWSSDDPLNKKGVQFERLFKFNILRMEMISRLMVRLSEYIVDNIIWKNGVLVKYKNGDCFIKFNVSKNLIQFLIRGKDVGSSFIIYSFLFKELEANLKSYPGVTFHQLVRSPYSPEDFIDLDTILKEAEASLDSRKLLCPQTHFPLRAEDLLESIGQTAKRYVNFNINSVIERFHLEHQRNDFGLKMMSLIENQTIKNEAGFSLLASFLSELKIERNLIKNAVSIQNGQLFKKFSENYLRMWMNFIDDPFTYKKDDWRTLPLLELRRYHLRHIADYIGKFRSQEVNQGDQPFIVPLLHQVGKNSLLKICENGFIPTNEGLFGNGIYFTSNLEYALQTTSKDQVENILILSLVTLGNIFPSIEFPGTPESYSRKPCRPGYQSHYVLVHNHVNGFPIHDLDFEAEYGNFADQVVVFQTFQALPMFILYL